MRKAISGIGQLIGILVALFGIIVCMGDMADLDKLFVKMLVGLGIFLSGVGIVALANRGEEDVYRR